MAEQEEKIIFEVSYDTKAAEQNIDRLSGSINSLEAENKQLRTDMKKTDAQLKTEGKTRAGLTTAMAKNKQSLSGLKKEQRDEINVVKTQANSLNALKAQTSRLVKERNNLDTSTKQGQKRFNQLNKQIKSNTNQLKSAEQAGGDYRRSVGKYGDAMQGIPGPAGQVVNSIRGITTAAKAFIATPVGAVIAAIALALGALTTHFRNSEKGQNDLNKVMAVFSTILGNVQDLVAKVGERVFEAFNDPQQAVKDLWEAIKNNIVNRVTGVIDLFVGLGNVGQNAFKLIGAVIRRDKDDIDEYKTALGEAAKTAGQAFIQFQTGLDVDQQKRFAQGIRDVIDETNREIEVAKGLADARANLDKIEREAGVTKAKNAKRIADLVLLTRQEGVANEDKMAALKEASRIKENELKLDMFIAKERLRIKEQENALSESTKEDLNEEARLRADVFKVEKQNADQRRELINREVELNNRIRAETKKTEDRKAKANEKLQELNEELLLSEIENAEERREKEIEFAEAELERKLEEKNLLDEEIELLELEHRMRVDEINQEFAEKEQERIAKLKDKQKEAFDEVKQAASQLADDRTNIAASTATEILRIQDQQTDEQLRALETLGAATQGFTNLVKASHQAQLNDLQKQKAAELSTVEQGSEAEKQILKKFAEKEAQLRKKQFQEEKSASLLEAGIATALAVTKALPNLVLAGIIGVAGAAQVGIIASKQPPQFNSDQVFAKGGELKTGMFGGRRHRSGGTNLFDDSGQRIANVEKGERFFVMNRDASAQINALSAINERTGGRSFGERTRHAQEGGEVPATPADQDVGKQVVEALSGANFLVRVGDIETGLDERRRVKNVSVVQ